MSAGARPSTVRISAFVTWTERDEARVDRRPVDEHGARPALSFPATLLGPGEGETLAEHVEKPAHPGTSTSTGVPLTDSR